MKPLSTTQQEQDKLFDELCIGCGFGAANIQGLKEFMRTRDLAIENAVKAELVEKIVNKAREKRAILIQAGIVDAPILLEQGEIVALLTTSPSR